MSVPISFGRVSSRSFTGRFDLEAVPRIKCDYWYDKSLCRCVQIAASMVKELRQQSGAGMMDCKQALQETGGDTTAAAELLRKKGLASAGKKAGRVASEGRIGSYIHNGSRWASSRTELYHPSYTC